jgi:plastocyanin
MHRRRLIALAALGAATVAAGAAPALAGPARSKSVEVSDDYFAPTRLTVKQGTRLVFRWPSGNYNNHNVKLQSAPRGVSTWHSPIRRSDYTYRRTLRTPGTYKIICTLHPTQMRLTVRVRRAG